MRAIARPAVLAAGLCLLASQALMASSPPTVETMRASRAGRLQELRPMMPDAGVPAHAIPTASAPNAAPVPQDAARPTAAPLPPTKIRGGYPRGLHPVIKHSMVEASRYLPEGWQLEFMNALRDARGVWNGPHGKRDKTGGALAVDVWLVNPKGERLCNFQCRQTFEPYQTFMQMVKHIQDRDFPAYRNQGRWGGYFGGRYANDEMHYDLEPTAWTAAGNWEKGLFAPYAHFGKAGDVGKGMGSIAGYRLPESGTLASLETPPAAVAAGPQMRPVAVAAAPAAPKVAALVKAAPKARRAQQTYRQALHRSRAAQADEDEAPAPRGRWRSVVEQSDAEEAPRLRVRYAQYSREGRRNRRIVRDDGDD
ncbi:MAG: hypothetical protein NW223_12435 [Hyphomicrobiaceae bacterium]|nr:hypothetical protein [Hyphomicrobiaceae bacterium]